uniref:NADH dehydrogenase [ubiquinone] 1 beta subcomplex subunit 9 n=1 Tax=Sus scrofa TaxID=9823 RepID=A0A5G2R954_PIG
MAFSAPAAYLTHQQKVLRLYKRALRHLESWCVHRDKYRYFACLMRARFDEHKNEKDMVKATQLLRQAEEEFWYGQHPQPYIFPESPGGTSYERYECYKVPEWCLDDWHPSEKAMYPDYFAKREQWKRLRRESWEREVSLAYFFFGQHPEGVRFCSPCAEVQVPALTVTLAPCLSDILS